MNDVPAEQVQSMAQGLVSENSLDIHYIAEQPLCFIADFARKHDAELYEAIKKYQELKKNGAK